MKSKNLLRDFVRGSSTLVLLLLFAVVALAQQGTSTVRGTVKDPQGNVVSGATVKLISLATNAERTTTTTGEGLYSFEAIQVGDYKIEVEAPNFKKAVVTDIHALVASSVSVDVQLEVGNIAETVTVTAGGSEVLVNRDDGTLGNTFVSK